MADTKLTALPDLGALSLDDLLYVVNAPGATPASGKVTVQQLLTLFLGSLPAAQYGHLVVSGAQAIPTSSWTAIAFASAPYDTGGFWSAAAPTRLTIPATGVYLVGGLATMAAYTVTTHANASYLSALYLDGAPQTTLSSPFHGVGTSGGAQQILLPLSVGSYLEVRVLQMTGGSLNTGPAGSEGSRLFAIKLA